MAEINPFSRVSSTQQNPAELALIREAVRALRVYGGVDDPTPEQLARVHLVCHLASQAPAVTLHWIDPDSEARRLVGEGNALALTKRRAVVIPPLIDDDALVIALHEIGHTRVGTSASLVFDETSAWKWAVSTSPIYSGAIAHRLAVSLGSYLRTAEEKRHVIDVIEGERFIASLAGLRKNWVTPTIGAIRMREFYLEHGHRPCESRDHAAGATPEAIAKHGDRFACGDCSHALTVADRRRLDERTRLAEQQDRERRAAFERKDAADKAARRQRAQEGLFDVIRRGGTVREAYDRWGADLA